MTASTLRQPTVARLRLSWLMVAIIALAGFAAGLGVATLADEINPAVKSATQVTPAFDEPRFRLEEHEGFGEAPVFDVAKFRAEERAR